MPLLSLQEFVSGTIGFGVVLLIAGLGGLLLPRILRRLDPTGLISCTAGFCLYKLAVMAIGLALCLFVVGAGCAVLTHTPVATPAP